MPSFVTDIDDTLIWGGADSANDEAPAGTPRTAVVTLVRALLDAGWRGYAWSQEGDAHALDAVKRLGLDIPDSRCFTKPDLPFTLDRVMMTLGRVPDLQIDDLDEQEIPGVLFVNARSIDDQVLHPYVQLACVVAVDVTTGHLVLQRGYRAGVDVDILELPGGRVDEGEDPLDAAVRELREETGYAATSAPARLTTIWTAPAIAGGVTTIAYVECEKVDDGSLEPSEVDNNVRVALVPIDEALARARNGSISDAKTIVGLLLAPLGGRGQKSGANEPGHEFYGNQYTGGGGGGAEGKVGDQVKDTSPYSLVPSFSAQQQAERATLADLKGQREEVRQQERYGSGVDRSAEQSAWQRQGAEDHAINLYSGAGYSRMNEGLRSGNVPADLKPEVTALDRAISQAQLSEGTTVFRGMTSDPGLQPGDKVTDPAYASTSMDPNTAWSFANGHSSDSERFPPGAVFRIDAPAGTPALGIWSGEHEVLLGRGTSYQVTGVSTMNTTTTATSMNPAVKTGEMKIYDVRIT